MGPTIVDVLNLGAGIDDRNHPLYDRLGVVANDADGNPIGDPVAPDGPHVAAVGWFSATTNHYGPELYDADGNRHPDAVARTMTPEEVGAYALRLLREQRPDLFVEPVAPAAVAPQPVSFAVT